MNPDVVTFDLLNASTNFLTLIFVVIIPILLIDYAVELAVRQIKSRKQKHTQKSPLDVVTAVNNDGPLLLESRGSYKD